MKKFLNNKKINWLPKKELNYERFAFHLRDSEATGYYTNYGPAVRRLESFLASNLGINKETHCVIAACNGTAAMHALISGICSHQKLNAPVIKTQSFTFPSSAQYGSASQTIIGDIDTSGVLAKSEIDGSEDIAVLTNIFGCMGNIGEYQKLCIEKSTILILDNAATPLTYTHIDNEEINSCLLADGAVVSLHHTKLLGFGEGGLIVAKKKYESSIREAINFGFSHEGERIWRSTASNWRMSDISAAAILQHVENFFLNLNNLLERQRFFIENLPKKLCLYPSAHTGSRLLSCFPILFPGDVETTNFISSGIDAKKYYLPLKPLKQSSDFFNRIICLPSHIDLSNSDMEYMIDVLAGAIKNDR